MTRYSRLLTWGIALTLAARPLAAQDARLVDRFPAPVLSRLTAVIDSTAHEGLPTEPLILRALEGSAKGATPDLIVAALTRLHAALRTARTTIGERAGVTELTTAASALEAGVPTARLMQLHQLRAGQPLTAPLAAYLDLIARGAAPDRAWDRIADLAKHRATDAAYGKLSPADIDHDPAPSTSSNPAESTELGDAWSLQTSGGTGRLDQLPGGTVSAFRGALRQRVGPFDLQYDGAATTHAGIGPTGTMTGDLRHSLASGAWQVDVGPTYAAGRDVGASWQSAAGLVTHASRTFGIWSLTGSLRGGLAWLRDGRSLWAGQTAGIAAHVGDFRFGALWQGTLVGDSSEQSTSSVFDTIPAPIDSVPFPTGGVVVRQSDVTTYRRRYRDVNDLSFATAWARGPVALQARVGRRLSFDRQSRSWWGVGGAFRLTPTVALTFNSSRTTADPLLHLRSEQSTTVGLRLAPPVHASRFQGDVPSSGIAIDRLPSGVFRLVFTLPNAEQSAAITGDLTGWKTTALLHRSDGRWEVLLPAPPGVYRINLRHDAGPWQAPPGLPATDDGFGGRVGLLVLER